MVESHFRNADGSNYLPPGRIYGIGSAATATTTTNSAGQFGSSTEFSFSVYSPGNWMPPGIPNGFYGTVYINGEKAGAGQVVKATLNNDVVAFSVNDVDTGQSLPYTWGVLTLIDLHGTVAVSPGIPIWGWLIGLVALVGMVIKGKK